MIIKEAYITHFKKITYDEYEDLDIQREIDGGATVNMLNDSNI